MVADNCVSLAISVAPDRRIKCLETLNRVNGRDFEVVVPTGEREGLRRETQSND